MTRRNPWAGNRGAEGTKPPAPKSRGIGCSGSYLGAPLCELVGDDFEQTYTKKEYIKLSLPVVLNTDASDAQRSTRAGAGACRRARRQTRFRVVRSVRAGPRPRHVVQHALEDAGQSERRVAAQLGWNAPS